MSVVTGERLTATANPILTGPRHDRIRALLSLPQPLHEVHDNNLLLSPSPLSG